MCVSVIIPTFNSSEYIINCLCSVIKQKEVSQIIIVDDGSSDNTFKICSDFIKSHQHILLLHHPNFDNFGPGVSRNLGLQHAQSKYVAFLDSDDYYLINRFTKSIEILEQQPKLDGIYTSVEDKLIEPDLSYNTESYHISKDINPPEALEAIIYNKYGCVQINGFVFNREFLISNEIQCSPLYSNEDMHLIYESCIKGEILLKATTARTIRCIHANNITHDTSTAFDNDIIAAEIWFNKIIEYDLSSSINRYFFKKHLHFRPYFKNKRPFLSRFFAKIYFATTSIIKHPSLLKKLFND